MMNEVWNVEPVSINYENIGVYENGHKLLLNKEGDVKAILYYDDTIKTTEDMTEEKARQRFSDESIHINFE